MPLTKSAGNMYDWVTNMHTHLEGECPHKCSYCYVQKNRFGVAAKRKGEPRLNESELKVNYGSGKTIFIEHMNDLFAEGIKVDWIKRILEHCKKYPKNKYVFQTKNPSEAQNHFGLYDKHLIGTTIETNRQLGNFSLAPLPVNRYHAMETFKVCNWEIFITIEPIMDFDINILTKWIVDLKPKFINIGADSKGCHLPEPSKGKLLEFIDELKMKGINIKQKSNLKRLLK